MRTPFVLSGSVEAARAAWASLGHAGVPPGSQGNTGKARVAPTCHPSQGWQLGRREKEGKLLLALRKVHRGCQALCVLNLGCECAQFSLGACGYGNALLWADLCESLCASGSVPGREATRSTSVVLAALLVPAQGALAWHQFQESFGLASQPWLIVSPSCQRRVAMLGKGLAGSGSTLTSTCQTTGSA